MFNDFDIFFDSTNACFQIRTKTNSYALDFDDDEKKEVFERLVSLPGDSLAGHFNTLIAAYDKAKVIDVLSSLKDYGLLPYESLSEVPELNAVCSTEAGPTQALKALDTLNIVVISDGAMGRHLTDTLVQRGATQAKYLSASLFASFDQGQVDEMMEQTDFFFADASAWNPAALDILNKAALKRKKPWLYIGGVEEYQVKIGPLFLGNETGCYDCLIQRIKSNHGYVPYLNSYEQHLRSNLKSSKPDKFIHLDAYNSIVAEYAFLELTKFVQFWSVPSTWRRVLVINMLNYETQGHDLLKVPFCETCNQQHFYNPSPWLEPISLASV
jgi:bacteriocin biosynthesis cyclodehydratase domain-containing protein